MHSWQVIIEETPAVRLDADELPLPRAHTRTISYTPECEETVKRILEEYEAYVKEHGADPAYLVLGRRYYEDLVALISYRNRTLVIVEQFERVPIVVVPYDIFAFVPPPRKMLVSP